MFDIWYVHANPFDALVRSMPYKPVYALISSSVRFLYKVILLPYKLSVLKAPHYR